MNCANHSDQAAVAFCRNCGKALCQNCTRDVRGVIYCESCLAAKMEAAAAASSAGFVPPQTPYQQVIPPGPATRIPPPPASSGPQPVVAGILAGFFPIGVGAVYCSQYAKGLAYLIIMVLLGYGGDHAGSLGGLFIAGFMFFWVFQIIDAVRTARALQMGQPVPDPLGITQAFGGGDRLDAAKIPVGAVVLIGLGVLFLLHTMGLWEFGFERYWPLLIVAVGVWMLYRQWQRTSRRCNCARCHTRWLMGPVMVLTTGVVLLLHTATPLGLDRTWPAWILAVGVVKLVQSTASSAGHVGPLPPGPPPSAPPPPPDEPQAPTEDSSGEVNHV